MACAASSPSFDPHPWQKLRAAFGALVSAAGGIGALYVAGMVDYFLGQRLRRGFESVLAEVRGALLDRALALLPTLRRPRTIAKTREGARRLPRFCFLGAPQRPPPPAPPPAPPAPYPGFGPRIRSFDAPYRETIIPDRIPFAAPIALRRVLRMPAPETPWGRAKPASLCKAYFELPAKVPAKPLARLLEGLARVLDDPDKYARKLALTLRREARDESAPFNPRREMATHRALARLAYVRPAARKERVDPLAAPWPPPPRAPRGQDPPG